jgi:cobalt-zinc-cadmium efflux system outer membrane protein
VRIAAPLALLLAACAAPEPLPLRDFEIREERFAPPRRDAESLVRLLREKDALTLDDVLAITDVLHPRLESERRNVDLAAAAIWDAGLYPNPSLLADIEEARTGEPLSVSKRVIGVSVPVVVGGRIGAATSLAGKQREIAAIQVVWKRREVLADAKRSFVDLLAARRRADLARETRDIALSLHQATEERYKAQAIPEMELLKSAVNLAKAETELTFAEKDAAVARKAVLAAMGDADFPAAGFSGELTAAFVIPSADALRGQVTGHPLLEASAKAKEAAELERDLARAERIPDVAIEAKIGDDDGDGTVLEAGIEIPLPLFNRNQGKIAAAEVRIRQAELEIQAVKSELSRRLDEAYRTLVAAQDRVAVYRDEILPKAQKALDQTREGHAKGKFGYLDVLDAQRTLAEARTAFVAALVDLNAAAVDLEILTGVKLK